MSEQPQSICGDAIERGDLNLVRTLIGPHNVNDRVGGDETPLIDACYYKQVPIVRYLILECGANVNIQTAGGTNPLWMALNYTVTDDTNVLLELLCLLVDEGGARVDHGNTLESSRRALAEHALSPARWKFISVGIEFLESRIPLAFASLETQSGYIHPRLEGTGKKQAKEVYEQLVWSFDSPVVAFHIMSFMSISDVDVPIIVPSKESLEKYPEWLSVDTTQQDDDDSQRSSCSIVSGSNGGKKKKKQNKWTSSKRRTAAVAASMMKMKKKLKSLYKSGKEKLRRKKKLNLEQ